MWQWFNLSKIAFCSSSDKLLILSFKLTIFGKQNSKFITNEYGTAIVYANGLVEQFGHTIVPNANDYVAQKTIEVPVSIDLNKDYSVNVSRYNQGNGIWGINSAVAVEMVNDNHVTLSLQNPGGGYDTANDKWRTVQWHIIGFLGLNV